MKLGEEIIWLSEKDVAELLSMEVALKEVEKAFRLFAEGRVQMPPKLYLEFHEAKGDLRAMPAFIDSQPPMAGVKIVNSHPLNPSRGLPAVSGVMVFVDPATGMVKALLAAGNLTAIRTGAAGGLAAKYLARPESKTVGLVGCGKQARMQLQALVPFFPLTKVFVWGMTKEESSAFCSSMASSFKGDMIPTVSLEEACRADILVTSTPVRTPLVKSEWILPGTHINAIGADAPGKQELESALLGRSRVVVDAWIQASHAGEINVDVAAGRFKESHLAGELGQIMTGQKKGRLDEKDVTIFDSTGLALQDVAVAHVVAEKAIQEKKGMVLKFYG